MTQTHSTKDSSFIPLALDSFNAQAKLIHEKHRSQKVEDVALLNDKYLRGSYIFHKPISIWDAIEKLGMVSDPTDKELYAVSQWVHTLQVIEGMELAGIKDEQVYLAAWLHDLGKLLLLTNEDPANIVCDNFIISGKTGVGLDNCVVNWNHDEWVYLRLKNIVNDEIAWLVRYHSVNLQSCMSYFDQKDRRYAEKYLDMFRRFDKGTKSLHNIPKIDIDKHRRLIEKHLPEPILL